LQVGLKSRKYVLSWAKPFFMDTPWTVGFDIERSNNRYISNDYEITSTALITHANYRYNDFVRFGWHYRLKNSDVDISRKHRHRKDKKKQEKKVEEKGFRKGDDVDGLISATGISLTYDSTDHPVAPEYGFRSNIDLEIAGLGGDHSFF